jgi:hypothetical protein
VSENVYQKPIGRLCWGSPVSDEGSIQLDPEFLEAHPIMRIDIMGDWIAALTELRNQTIEEEYSE